MQKKVLAEKVHEQAKKLLQLLPALSSPEHLSLAETEHALHETEQLARVLSAWKFVSEHKEQSSDLHVHMKIMETINKQEEIRTVTDTAKTENTTKPLTAETIKQEPALHPEPVHKEEARNHPASEESKVIIRRKIEFGINDKYRMINELFHQSGSEFSAALDQLNLTETPEDAENYLDSLKTLYSWKAEHPLVKMLYSLTQKRFH